MRSQCHRFPEFNDEHTPKMERLCLVQPLRSSWFSLRHLISFTEAKHLLPSLAPLL